MTRVVNLIKVGTIISMAAFAGVMLCIYTSHLTIWKQAPPQEFLHLFQRFSPGISNATGLTGILGLLLSIITLIITWKSKNTSIYWTWSFVLISSAIVLTMVYFVRVNGSFTDQSILLEDVPKTLETWGMLHSVRIVMATLAAVFGGIGIIYESKESSRGHVSKHKTSI